MEMQVPPRLVVDPPSPKCPSGRANVAQFFGGLENSV